MANFLVIDNFLKDPTIERDLAQAAEFKTVEHNKINYQGICETQNEEQFSQIRKLFETESGKFVCYWRRYLESDENETYIHSDCDLATYTGILFLNLPPQCSGGTALWKYRQLGWDLSPSAEDLAAKGIRDDKSFWDKLYKDGFDEFSWEMIDYVPMAFNRLILFDSRRFHSRFPQKAFGKSALDGRLIKVFFFTP